MGNERELHCPSCDKDLLEGKYCPYCQAVLVKKGELRADPEFEDRVAEKAGTVAHEKFLQWVNEREEKEQREAAERGEKGNGEKGSDEKSAGRGFFRS